MADMQKPADTENDAAAKNVQPDEIDELLDEIMNEDTDAAPKKPADAKSPATISEQQTTDPAPQKQPTTVSSEKNTPAPAVKSNTANVVPAVPDEEEYEDDDEEDESFFGTGKNKKKRKRKKLIRKRRKGRGISCALITLTFIISAAVLSSVTILAVAKELYGIDKDIEKKNITVPTGATVADVADQLYDEGLIRLKKVFRVISRLSGKDTSYIPGDHELSPNMSYEAMIEELCYNHAQDREYVRVTFTEGTNLLDIAKQLEENEVCDAEEFVFYFNAGGYGFKFEDYIPKNEPLRFQNREGYCFPDTYEFYVGEDPEIVVQKIYENFDKKITSADYRAMDELGMTLDDVITLSSIVQAEAPSFEDMKMVAGVFHNRLNNPGVFTMLQSDPTRKYAEEVIQPYLASQQREDPLMCNEYNTYIGQGLPPGAINNPGKDAITAVLYPESSNYYYFVANVQTGETFYAVDLKAHNDNIAKIKQQQAEAGLADDGDN